MTNEGRGEEIRELVEEGENEEKIGSNCQDKERKREERERKRERDILMRQKERIEKKSIVLRYKMEYTE